MANQIEITVTAEALAQVKSLREGIKLADAELLKLAQTALNTSKSISSINSPAGLNANSATNANTTAKIQQQANIIIQNNAKIEQSYERMRLADIKLQQQREKSVDTFVRNEAKEQQALHRSETAYQRIQASVGLLTKTYQDLAIRKQLGSTLTVKEEAQLLSLTNRLNQYQSALKKVDADIQKNQRNVGNYASGFNGLGNSINQITRELPAFTFSAQTGFLALSNNIPILTDEIGKLQRANKELIAQGKPVTSIFSQILGSVLSLQTAMGIGILLFTLYGKEISSFVGNLFSFEKALTATEIAQKQMTESSKEGVRSAQEELTQLKINLGIAQDVTKSYEQRKLAVNQLKETYPDYLKNISDEAILSGKAETAINSLTIAIINNSKAQAAKGRILENETKRLDLLDEEIRLNEEIAKQDAENIRLEPRVLAEMKTASDRNIALDRYNNGTARSISLRRDLANNTKELNRLDEINNRLSQYAVKNTTLFDEKKTKSSKEKIRLNFEETESEYNLRLAILERQKAEISDRVNNETSLLDARLSARKEFTEKSIEIYTLELEKEKALLKLKYDDDIAKNRLALKNNEITRKEYSKNASDINNRYNNEIAKSDVDSSVKWRELVNADLAYYKKIEDEKRSFTKQTNDQEVDSEKNKYKAVFENEDLILDVRQKAYEEYALIVRKELDLKKIQELANAKSAEEIAFIESKYKNLNEQFDLAVKTTSPLAQHIKANEKAMKDFIETASKGFLKDAGLGSLDVFLQLDKNGQTAFERMMERADTFKEKFAVTFQAISEFAQEAFNFINQASQQNFDAEYRRLELQKETAIKFAGDSTTAQERINTEYDRRKREIQRREAEAQKKIAVFNILINTAQGVVSALASTPPNVPLSIAIGLIGALQAGIVQSQPIPQFFEGGTHKGGIMMVNDAKGNSYKETVVTPDGKIIKPQGRNVLMNAPAGTEIFTPEQWKAKENALGNMLAERGISFSPNVMRNFEFGGSTGLSKSDFDNGISKLQRTLSNAPTSEVRFDEKGYRKFTIQKGQRTEKLNRRFNIG